MQITMLDELRFNSFAMSHPNYNFYQSSNYGNFMTKHGYNAYYLGLTDDVGGIKAATLMIVKNEEANKRKMGYCPRGFLIDWNDDNLVSQFTESLKTFLASRGFTYLKVDPMVVYKEHFMDGSENTSGQSNLGFVEKMQSLGYIHMGYNNGMEASKPRWNAYTILNSNTVTLYNSISKNARDKIMESFKMGNKVYKGTNNDISLLYSIINKPNPPLEYYLDYYQFFSQNNGFELYFAKLEPVTFVDTSKRMFEEEEERNNNLNMQLQDMYAANKDVIINEKLKSDDLLAKYKSNMIEAVNLFQKYPSGLVIAGVAVIKYGKKVTFLASGANDSFKEQHAEYLLRWQLMEQFAREGYEIVDFNGMIGDFNSTDYNTVLKRELSNKIVEYVGEFDLVINKKSYYTGSKLNPIINWLNTPI